MRHEYFEKDWKGNVIQLTWTSKAITQKTGLSEQNPQRRSLCRAWIQVPTCRNLKKWDNVKDGGSDVHRGRTRLRPDTGRSGKPHSPRNCRNQPRLRGLLGSPEATQPRPLRRSRQRLRLRSGARVGGAARDQVSWLLGLARDLLRSSWGRGSREAGA